MTLIDEKYKRKLFNFIKNQRIKRYELMKKMESTTVIIDGKQNGTI